MKTWYLIRAADCEAQGPYPLSDLLTLRQAGHITHVSMLRLNGTDKWEPALDVMAAAEEEAQSVYASFPPPEPPPVDKAPVTPAFDAADVFVPLLIIAGCLLIAASFVYGTSVQGIYNLDRGDTVQALRLHGWGCVIAGILIATRRRPNAS